MSLKNITVEGQKLSEFLSQSEPVKEEIERNKFFKEQTSTVRLGRHVKARYKQHKEKNGKVKILGQREINITNFEKYLKISLENENILNSFVIVMTAYPYNTVFTTQNIADIIDDFSKKNGMPILRSTNHSLRGRLGIVRKSELSDFMFFLDRNTPKNTSNIMKYGLTDDALETLSIDDAIELARTRKKEFKDKKVVLNPNRSRQKNAKPGPKPKAPPAAPPVKIPKNPPAEAPQKPDLVSEIIDQLKELKNDDSAVFVIKGDIHIHVNIERG